jgi:hypothetical protein
MSLVRSAIRCLSDRSLDFFSRLRFDSSGWRRWGCVVHRRVFHYGRRRHRRPLRGDTRIYRLALLQRRRSAVQVSSLDPRGDQSHRRRPVCDKCLAARQQSRKFGREPECSRRAFDHRRRTPLRIRLARRSNGARLRCQRRWGANNAETTCSRWGALPARAEARHDSLHVNNWPERTSNGEFE